LGRLFRVIWIAEHGVSPSWPLRRLGAGDTA
jgi:hypothetical protein